MSATHDSEDKKSISLRVPKSDLETFMQALRRAQAEGIVPVDMSRSEAIRRSMLAAAEDPTLLAEADE